MRVALDTNVLVYAEGLNGAERAGQAGTALELHAADELVVPVQALAELFMVLTRKAKWPAARARAAVLTWHDACLVVETSTAVMLEAAAQAGRRVLLSDDRLAGFVWRGVEVRNPFGG